MTDHDPTEPEWTRPWDGAIREVAKERGLRWAAERRIAQLEATSNDWLVLAYLWGCVVGAFICYAVMSA